MNKHVDTHLATASKEIEERCKGYQLKVRQTASQLVALEREHKIRKTNIKVKLDQELQKLAKSLAGAQGPR